MFLHESSGQAKTEFRACENVLKILSDSTNRAQPFIKQFEAALRTWGLECDGPSSESNLAASKLGDLR